MKIFKRIKRNVEKELASEIVEILEEKLDEKKVNLPQDMLEQNNDQVRFRKDLRKELVYEIEDFISINRIAFFNKKAA